MSRICPMNAAFLKRMNVFWKIVAIAGTAFAALVSSFIPMDFIAKRHDKIMLVSFILAILFCGLLVADILKLLRLQQEKIESLMGVKLALTSLIDLKDPYTKWHSRNTRDLSKHFAEYLKLPPEAIDEIALAAELHDIGKIGIPDHILKKQDKLKEEEFQEIKKHPMLGAEAVRPIEGFENIVNIIASHHERFDGTGYPHGFAAGQIPFGARVISILDAYDAMAHGRAYRKAMSSMDALGAIEKNKGTQFDPELASQFARFIQTNPHGSHYDPVCGMAVNPRDPVFQTIFRDRRYVFCSEVCEKEFARDPEKFAAGPCANENIPGH